jgi:hypothetical protein
MSRAYADPAQLSTRRRIASARLPSHDRAREGPSSRFRASSRMSRGPLALVAFLIGAGIVAADDMLFSLLTGRPLTFASDVEPVSALMVAMPFLVLALVGARPPAAVDGGPGSHFVLLGILYSGVSYQPHPDGSGADIGLGLIMLASPLFITAAVLAAHFAQRRASAPA